MGTKVVEELTGFFDKNKLYKYKKGEIIYRPGDSISHVSFVKSGYVKLYILDQNGQSVTINFFKPLFFLTFWYSVNNLPSRYYFEAVTDVEAWRAPVEEFNDFLDKNTKILFEFNQMLLKVLEETIFNMGNTVSGSSYKKVATILLSLSKQYGGKNTEGQIMIDFGTTHEDIASLTGLTRETVGIQINRLKDEKIITQESKYYIILNQNKLNEIAAID